MNGLTRRQQDLLTFIRGYMAEHNSVAPTYEEMAAALDVKSKSNIVRLVTGLRDRGHVDFINRRARTIRIIADDANAPCPHCGHRRTDVVRGAIKMRQVHDINGLSAQIRAVKPVFVRRQRQSL